MNDTCLYAAKTDEWLLDQNKATLASGRVQHSDSRTKNPNGHPKNRSSPAQNVWHEELQWVSFCWRRTTEEFCLVRGLIQKSHAALWWRISKKPDRSDPRRELGVWECAPCCWLPAGVSCPPQLSVTSWWCSLNQPWTATMTSCLRSTKQKAKRCVYTSSDV